MKKFLLKATRGLVQLNIVALGIGVFTYSFMDVIKKNFFVSDNERALKFKKDRNVNYEYFKNKFISEYSASTNNPEISSRQDQINNLSKEYFDILIIGGGSVGAGVLLDGYTRGFKCGLIEKNDFSSGTSSRSSKLIHGGLRYLEQAFSFDFNVGLQERLEKFGLVKEAMKERDFFLESAVFMNNFLDLTIKTKNLFDLIYYFDGILVYHGFYLAASEKFLFSFPKLDFKNYKIYFSEGQMNDSRQNVLSILTCCTKNYLNNRITANASNYIEFKDYIYNEKKEIIGVKVFDRLKKKDFEIKSKIVVNCTGIYCDDNFSQNDTMKNKMIKASKGSHIIFKNLPIKESIMIPKTSDGRVIFILPYNEYFLVGTTDIEIEKTEFPDVTPSEVDFIIREMVNYSKDIFDEKTLRENITSKWAGLRPLVLDSTVNNKNTKALSRSHVIRYDKSSKLYSLMGGKWTTYRNMGNELINEIVNNEITFQIKELKDLDSKNIKLKGSVENYRNITNCAEILMQTYFFEELVNKLSEEYKNLNKEIISSLVKRHGVNSVKILYEGEKNKQNRVAFSKYLESEIRYLIKNEMAIKPNDIICRRLGIGFLDDKISEDAVPIVSKILGEELNINNKDVKILTEESLKYLANKF